MDNVGSPPKALLPPVELPLPSHQKKEQLDDVYDYIRSISEIEQNYARRYTYSEDFMRSMEPKTSLPPKAMSAMTPEDLSRSRTSYNFGEPTLPTFPSSPPIIRDSTLRTQINAENTLPNSNPNSPTPKPRKPRNQSQQVLCLDWMQGKCEPKRWKCKYAHPALNGSLNPSQLNNNQQQYRQEQHERHYDANNNEICRVWEMTGMCKFGDSCWHSHSLPDNPAPLRHPSTVKPQRKGKQKEEVK